MVNLDPTVVTVVEVEVAATIVVDTTEVAMTIGKFEPSTLKRHLMDSGSYVLPHSVVSGYGGGGRGGEM
jgi:hypothetical protein